MDFEQGKIYVLFDSQYGLKIYAKKMRNLQIFAHFEEQESPIDDLWIQGSFVDIKVLVRSKQYEDDEFCYIILEKNDEEGIVLDLLKKKIVLEDFNYEDFVMISKKANLFEDNNPQNYFLHFQNKIYKTYSLFSLDGKCIFGPYSYKSIIKRKNGVILDDKVAIEKNGLITDLTDYIASDCCPIFNSKDGTHSLLVLDEEGDMLHHLITDLSNKEMREAEIAGYKYTYNITTDEYKYVRIWNGNWSNSAIDNAADTAYEGHSRLELGLEG